MAEIKGQQTLNEVLILEVAGDPSITGGTLAPTGSIALDDTGKLWVKTSAPDTGWEMAATGTGTIYTEDVLISTKIGVSQDLNNLREWLNHMWSVGITAGANHVDNGNGTINISEGTALLREMSPVTLTRVGSLVTVYSPAHDLEEGEFVYIEGALQSEYNGTFSLLYIDIDHYTYQIIGTPVTPATGLIYSTGEHSLLVPSIVPAITNLALVDNSTNYVYASRDGTPLYTSTIIPIVLGVSNKALVYTIAREGNTLYAVDGRLMNVDAIRKTRGRTLETEGFKPVMGGSSIGAIGTRNLTVTAGAFYYGLQKISHNSFDTSTSDTFKYCYRNGSGGWTYTSGNTQLSNTSYDNGTGTLATLTGNNYNVHWVYMMNNSPSSLLVQYGQSDYPNISSAQAATVPTTPNIVLGVGALLGRVIIKKNDPSFADISSSFSVQFMPTVETDHESLAGLQGGTLNDHMHLTNVEYNSFINLNYQIDGGQADSNFGGTTLIDAGGA
jgi:hypothetical protein